MGDTHDTAEIDTESDDFAIAVAAVTRAIRSINAGQRPGDGGEFITHLIAAVAANLGSSHAVTARRSGSWEASGVQQLLSSTVGEDDAYLLGYRTETVELVVNSTAELDELDVYQIYEASMNHIGSSLFGNRWTPSRDLLSVDELEQIEDIEVLLYDLEDADRAEWERRFTAAVVAEYRRRTAALGLGSAVPAVNVQFVNHDDNLTTGWDGGITGELYVHGRQATPLPGTDMTPERAPGRSNAQQLLGAGHWPHLRISELAQYGTPTSTTTREEN
jgi:hypothetical protein